MKKDELPKRYEDLADARWKGRLGIEADDSEWLAGLATQNERMILLLDIEKFLSSGELNLINQVAEVSGS